MTFEEVYQQIRKMHYEILDERESISKSARLSLSTWMLDILTEYRDEWCDDCKRFNTGIRETLNREPSEDGTLEVKVEDATKVGRVLISDDKHRGGLYYPDEDEPQGDLISRAEAIKAVNRAKDEGMINCPTYYLGIVPSADRPKGKWIYWREDGIKRCKCSRCLTSYGCLDTPYCPNCGEKMVEGRSEE